MEKLCTQHETDARTVKLLENAKVKLSAALAAQNCSHQEELDKLLMICKYLKKTEGEFGVFVTVSVKYYYWFVHNSYYIICAIIGVTCASSCVMKVSSIVV